MPEIKQNFTRGKMNKDLDERLIPKGEYREAQNIHITESEGSDVGAIENILGNKKINGKLVPDPTAQDEPSLLDGTDYEVIGYCKDLRNKRIVYFITNFASDSFTDNIRSISRAQNAGTPNYTNNAQHSAIVLHDLEDNTTRTLVFGSWLNLSKNHLITGVSIIDDMLFWTDNLNQPRKINIQLALDNYLDDSDQYYDCEETVSLAKYAPYKPIMLHNDAGDEKISRDSGSAGLGELPEYMKEKFIRFSYRYKYDDGEYSLIAPFTQAVFEPLNKGIITNSSDDDEKNTTSGEPAVLTGKKEVYKKGIVDIMQNRINKVEMRVPLPAINEFRTSSTNLSTYDNDFHIKEVEILLKESDGISFKLVKTINIDELSSDDLEFYTVKPISSSSTYYRHCFKYTYNSYEPYAVLTEEQVNRVSDQVPVLAKALDVVGNRVVFGNYVENYPYPIDNNGDRGINYKVDIVDKGAVDQEGTLGASAPYLNGLKQWMHKVYKYHSLKQRRTYQVGIVFSDIFGRQSPVILSSNKGLDADTITSEEVTATHTAHADGAWVNSGNNSGSYGESLVIEFQDASITSDLNFVANMAYGANYNPHGWYSYRIVVKQKEQEYYNVYAPHTFDGWNNISEEPEDTFTGGRSWLFLHGDNVNKIPRSLNDTDLNRDGTMGSNVRLYPKVIFDTDGESKQNNSYHELTEVISLGTAYEQNLYISGDDNKSGTGGFNIYDFVYGKSKNPLVAELQNMKVYTGTPSNNQSKVLFIGASHNANKSYDLYDNQLTTSHYDVDSDFISFDNWSINTPNIKGQKELTVDNTDTAHNQIDLSSAQDLTEYDKIVLSNYYEGLSVFETEPFYSKLDIYYETSTSGLVADLVEEINVLEADLPTNIQIKQDTYDFGTGQDPVPNTDPNYGSVLFLYENTSLNTYIGDISATKNTPSGTLSFDITRITRLGDGSNQTSSFSIVNDGGTYKLNTTDKFAFRNNSFDEYKVKISATDSASGTSYQEITLFIKNSKPTISSLPASISLTKEAGSNSIVISENNLIENGSAITNGDPDRFTGLSVSRSFGDSSFDSYFDVNNLGSGEYELKTNSNWTVANANTFFEGSNSDRTVTITISDGFGATATASTRIDESTLGGIQEGILFEVDSDSTSDICSGRSSQALYYATTGSSSNDPGIYPFYGNNLQLFVGNVVYTEPALTNFILSGKYASYVADGKVRVVDINSSGVITSAEDVDFVDGDC